MWSEESTAWSSSWQLACEICRASSEAVFCNSIVLSVSSEVDVTWMKKCLQVDTLMVLWPKIVFIVYNMAA